MRVTYVGGPTALLEIDGWRILTDPTFDPPGKRYFFGWGTVSRKQQGPAVGFDALAPIDAVLLSHDHHGDNLDPTGRELLPQMGTVVSTAPGARRLGDGAIGLAPWETTTLQAEGKPTLRITATPCRHGPPGSKPIVGDVVGFVVQWDGQEHGALWITGDTVLTDPVREVASRVDVGTLVVHLGAVTFPWLSGPLRYTMNAAEAVELAGLCDPATIVPLHYEGWKHFREQGAAAHGVLDGSPLGERVRWLTAGAPEEIAV